MPSNYGRITSYPEVIPEVIPVRTAQSAPCIGRKLECAGINRREVAKCESRTGEASAVAACYYLASVNSTASLVIVPFEIAMNLPSAEKR
jgi:hypothetical protein